ncbi:MAG: hypothetical protein GQ574_01155 [Crocinitomix sp.]|nr:hypothetical protein [Crocinitomix sp.]
MAIFLSKNSIGTFSKSNAEYLANEHFSSALHSELLTRSTLLCDFYVKANKRNISVNIDTKIDNPGLAEAFSILKTAMLIVGFSEDPDAALFVLSDIFTNQKELNEFSSVHKFDAIFEDILLLYKDVFDLGDEPTIDAPFLYHLDEQLVTMKLKGLYHAAPHAQKLANGAFDSMHFKFIGHQSEVLLNLNGVENDDGKFDYNIGLVYEDGTTTISFEEDKIQVNQVITQFDEFDDGPDQEIFIIDNKTAVELSNIDPEIKFYSPAGVIASEHVETIADNAQMGQSEDFVYYKIQPGDTFSSIINDQYYSDEDLVINDIDGNYIMSFPAQSMFSPGSRNQDVKLKFYLNYVYYYNVSKSEDAFIENGIATEPSSHLTEEQLDDFYNFSIAPDIDNPETLLTNTERFINYKSTVNPGSEVIFDALGLETFYTLTPGSIIKLPNRQSADSFFNHINFRPEVMLEELADKYAYVEEGFFEGILAGIDEAIDLLVELYEETKAWLKEVWRSIVQFFKDVYNYAIETLTRTWIRGVGGYIDAALGITWGIPIATDFEVYMRMYRKVTNIDELVLVLFKSGEFKGYLDAGVGVSYGYYSANGGSKRSKNGAQAVAGIEAGIKLYGSEQYEFPIRPEETALLAALGACLGPFGTIATGLASYLLGYNIDPAQYLVKSNYSFSLFFAAYAAGSLGGANTDSDINDGNKKLKYDKNKGNSDRNDVSKGWMSSESIWDKVISGIGVLAEGELELGYSYNYSAKYDNKPMVHSIDARVPSEVETENNYFAKGKLNVGPMGGFLQRLLVNSTIGNFLSALNFDKGVSFAVVNRVTRNGSVAEFELDNILVNFPDISGYSIESHNGNIKYVSKNVETEWRFNLDTGDYEGFLTPGSTSYLTLNTFELSTTTFAEDFEFSDIPFVIGLFKNVGFKHSSAIGLATGSAYRIAENIIDIDASGFEHRKNLLKKNSTATKGIELGVGIGGEIEFDLEEIFSTIMFYFKRAMLFINKSPEFKNQIILIIHNLQNEWQKDELFYTDEDGEEVTDPKSRNNILFTKTMEYLEDASRPYLSDITFDKIAAAFVNMVGMVFHIDELLNPPKIQEVGQALVNKFDRYTGVPDILKICSQVLDSIKTNLFVEASAGVTKGWSGSLAGGAKVRLMFRIGLGFILRFDIVEDGKLTIQYPDGIVPDGFEDFYVNVMKDIKAEIDRVGAGIEDIFLNFIDPVE